MDTLELSPFPFYYWLFNNWNGIVEYVMINGQLCLDWPYHWPLSDLIGKEILRVSNSDGIEERVNEDDESIASNTPSTEIEDEDA